MGAASISDEIVSNDWMIMNNESAVTREDTGAS